MENIEILPSFNFGQFQFNVEQLNYRINKAWHIDTTRKENHSEYLMVFDSALCLFRAMFLEKENKNYTYQNYFRSMGRQDIADKIDNYLDNNAYSNGVSIRNALKFLSDKFVCHVDNVSEINIATANYYMATLHNPYAKFNMKEIMNELYAIMGAGERDRT